MPDSSDRVSAVFAALSDATRREILDVLVARRIATATTIASQVTVSRQAVLKHLGALADAGLVSSHRQGREVRYQVRPDPLREASGWLAEAATAWEARLATLKAAAEAAHRTGDPPA